MSFSGGHSKEATIRKLLSAKPDGITVTKSEGKDDEFCVEGVTLSAIENGEEIEILKSQHPDIFKPKGDVQTMDFKLEELKEIVGMIVDSSLETKMDAKLKSFKEDNDKNFANLTKSIGEMTEALKSKKDATGEDSVLKSEDVAKIVEDTMKEKVGELAQAALKAKQDGVEPGKGDTKDPKEQFNEDMIALCKGEKSFEDFSDVKYVAKLKSTMELVTAEVFHNIAGTEPGKVDSVFK
jgi:hypothetical protein